MSENSKMNMGENIQVCIRMKPFSANTDSETKAQIFCEDNTLIFPGNGV